MGIYCFMLCFILINGITARKYRKWYVFSTFFVFFLFAALRKYTIGIDLELHYAKNFERIAALSWKDVPFFSAYDPGFNVLCKLISYLSKNGQVFIAVTSFLVFGSVGRYIYLNGKDVVLESFLFLCAFCYMMYMNIIAQAVAMAVFLYGIEFLKKKKYIAYGITILISASMHISAIILLLFLPLSRFKVNRKNVIKFSAILVVILVIYRRVFELVATVIPEFERYLETKNVHGQAAKLGIFNFSLIMIYVGCFVAAFIFIYTKKRSFQKQYYVGIGGSKYIEQINTNLLSYSTLIVICSRIASLKISVSSRVGYYFCPLAFTLLSRSIEEYKDVRMRFLLKMLLYVMISIFFLWSAPIFGAENYGAVPYQFYWE